MKPLALTFKPQDFVPISVKSSRLLFELDGEQGYHPHPQAVEHYREFLNTKHSAGALLKNQNTVFGYALWVDTPNSNVLTITRLAVHPNFRRRTVGSQLLRRARFLGSKPHTEMWVPESDVAGQCFCRAHGLRFQESNRDHFYHEDSDTTETGYLLTSCPLKPTPPKGPLTVDLVNRVSQHFKDE